MNRKVYLGK